MHFLNNIAPPTELTYSDVFLVPSLSAVPSRMDVDLTTPDGIGTTLPLVVANMTAVAGRRMSETVARRGGVAIIPQDIPADIVASNIAYVKNCHSVYETAITLGPTNTIGDALALIHKRSHGAVIVEHDHEPIGLFTEADAVGFDRFTQLKHVITTDHATLVVGTELATCFDTLAGTRHACGPVVDAAGKLVGILTRKGALRSAIYRPAVDTAGRLMIGVAIGINGDPGRKAAAAAAAGADIIVVDTAHGHQTRTLHAVKLARDAAPGVPIIAGNVVTAAGTSDLIDAGADIVKVGVGPGAMCTTRMMTGVGRPQFSAVLECATEARKLGRHVWADGGVRHPRDVALALAAGASNVMFGSWLAGTYESAADTLRDTDGRLYKESFGMASSRAVKNRSRHETAFERARKELFQEGISTSRMYLQPDQPGVEDIIDTIVAGVRSSCTYAGAATVEEFRERAIVGVQSSAGYEEGRPVGTSW